MQTAPWEIIDRYGFPLVRVAARLQRRSIPSAKRLSAQITAGLKRIPSGAEQGEGTFTSVSHLVCHDREWSAHVTAMIEVLGLIGMVKEALNAEPSLVDLLPLLDPPPKPAWEDDEPCEIVLDL